MAGRLIVEQLDGETLVYDTERHEAHALSGSVASEFAAAPDDVSRREVIRKLTLVGAAAAGAAPFIRTIVAPAPASAQSCLASGTLSCNNGECCTGCCCTTPTFTFCASDLTNCVNNAGTTCI
jgi:hypothetical protein